jgi:hypothetical protein
LPEVLAIGGDQRVSGPLSDLVAIMRKRKAAFANGELVSLGGRLPVKVITLNVDDVSDHYTRAVEGHYGTRNYAVQQMLIPDPDGKYADEPGCKEP